MQKLGANWNRSRQIGAGEVRLADIFISYTAADRDWAFWIGQELEKRGHVPHIHEWEIAGGGDIAAWMEERHNKADHILCVISKIYLTQPYSSWERHAAQWAATTERPNFALPVFIEDCKAPALLAHFKRCDLAGLGEDDARARLAAFLAPAGKPPQCTPFPGGAQISPWQPSARSSRWFPGNPTPTDNSRATTGPLNGFILYSYHDHDMFGRMLHHLAPLEDDGLIRIWKHREIEDWEEEIYNRKIGAADIILLLVSASFLKSRYCREELLRAIEQRGAGKSLPIPIILRLGKCV